ncbi:hypothetical protein ACFSUS_02095 [Spirosoma soli]|uniref:Uncharacterized protein n=1 Tax=Spirosoma soli TaxID=1770529 RepID=A0ABW5LXA3_9BACT
MTTATAQQLEEFVQDVLITIHANIRDLEEKKAFAERYVGPPYRARLHRRSTLQLH